VDQNVKQIKYSISDGKLEKNNTRIMVKAILWKWRRVQTP